MLKKIAFFITFLFSQSLNAQINGIKFVKTSLKNAFEIAEKQSKLVFIEILCHWLPTLRKFQKNF